MQLYNVELFEPDFTYRDSAQVEELNHSFDYLDIEKTKIKIPGTIKACKGDWIRIRNKKFEAVGIISDVKIKAKEVELEYKPASKIFNVKTYMDFSGLDDITVELWLSNIIRSLYIDNEDSLQNVKGLEIKVTSGQTGGTFSDYETGINNLFSVIIDAFTLYGIVCLFSMDVQRKKVILTIGTSIAEKFTIESDLPTVLEKDITIKEAKESTNKLIVYNEADYTESVVYYRDANDNITTVDTDRVSPVVFDSTVVKVSNNKTFAEVALSKAQSTLKATQYDNLIEITTTYEDELVRPLERVIGQKADIISGTSVYSTVLTGMDFSNDSIKLIFGTIRLELTKQLKSRWRKENV
ncbi:MAG: hypothetical protein PHP50_11025 [Lachnospiraceae bacterium]|nr:hypothetical protein [Lachnospiraceae bacterium]